ncbi:MULTISPECIES: M48 family metallopeptidase [Paraburkholderia]|uniref:M48 family metallopeptidase n=1 Tax=Paraburkholderia TaxID=1822464 RepID=UPI00224E05CD|nr:MULTISPECIES: SprT family zinc-dependent metalloprotease [Paraburkholderia]MCX4156649.1 SprT family zinc-dependent metalloprotease [Paraburkholderia aspalathi]MDN7166054.1 M48 family metallopeptidase [Paraburkholderia sp. SECH2]MDQ6394540.1 M48 family metallopeptidase [Paraburkholderia aspalathi]
MSDDAIRLAVIGKLGWIRRQQQKFEAQPRQSKREMVSGESHYYQGRRYRIRVVYHEGPATVVLRNKTTMVITVRPETSAEQRLRIVERWYRDQLKAEIPALLEKWQPLLGVKVAAWGIKKMKTKWGSCSINAGRIWVNLELAKKLPQCLEYILVHEMVHLMERHHNDRFTALMDRHLPHWRSYREELNRAPLGHEDWSH